MAHQCLECGEVYEEGSPELLQGCAGCGGTRFFFTQSPVSQEDREQIQAEAEEDLKGIVQQMLDQGVSPDYDDDIWSSDQRREWLAVDPETAGETVKEYVEEMSDEDEVPDEVPEGVEDLVDEVDQGVIDAVQVGSGDAGEDDGADVEPLLDDGPDAPEPARERDSDDDALDLDEKPPIEDEPPVGEVPPDPPVAEESPGGDPEPVPLEMWAEAADEAEDGDDEESRPEVVTVTEPGSYEIDVEALMGDSPIIVQNDGSYLVHLPSLFRSKKVRQGK